MAKNTTTQVHFLMMALIQENIRHIGKNDDTSDLTQEVEEDLVTILNLFTRIKHQSANTSTLSKIWVVHKSLCFPGIAIFNLF